MDGDNGDDGRDELNLDDWDQKSGKKNDQDEWSEQFLNGTSAYKRLVRSIEVIMEVKTNISNR